ncbi:hypothetical protein MUK42_19124, partial [Musa troglodytarum]
PAATGLDPIPLRLPRDRGGVRRRRRVRPRVGGDPPHPRYLTLHQLQRPPPRHRPLLPSRRLLLQLPPWRPGQPLLP